MGNSASPSCNPTWLRGSTPCLAYESIILFPSQPSPAGIGMLMCQDAATAGWAVVLSGNDVVWQPLPRSAGSKAWCVSCPWEHPWEPWREKCCLPRRQGWGRQSCRHQGPSRCGFLQLGNFGSLMVGQLWCRLGKERSVGGCCAGSLPGQRVKQSRVFC